MKDAQYWALDAANTRYDSFMGAQTVTMRRTNPGKADIKVGGAVFCMIFFNDAAGAWNEADYIGWASIDDSATRFTTYVALTAAAVAALL